jgi:hypothetical protein
VNHYSAWIEKYFEEHGGFVRGLCAEATTAMVAAFPELRRASGFVHVTWLTTSERPDRAEQHWWCVAPDGAVVDPTRAQFTGALVNRYEELDLDDPATRDRIPTGRCMGCGDDVFGGEYVCGDRCGRAVCADMGVPYGGAP